TERFRIARLLRHELDRFGSRAGKCSACRPRIAPHLSDYAFAPGPRKRDRIIVTSSDRQRSQGTTGAIEIALAKRYLKPKLGYVFRFARIFGNDRPDRRDQGARVGMPVELRRRTKRSHI